jgi:RND family efflux transporter MFP subunit
MKSLIRIVPIICFFAALIMVMPGCKGQKTAENGHGADVKKSADTAKIKVIARDLVESDFEDWGTYSADLRGLEDANLTAPAQGGRVASIKPIGTFVKAGDALCDIDGEKYEAALQAAQAQVDVAKGDLERAKVNVEKGSLGRSVLDAANLAYQNARMNKATTQRAYEDCRCQAPFDGVLVSRSIERFQTVSPGMSTVRLSRLDQLEAQIAIPESEAFGFTEGMKAEFRLLQNQNDERLYEGRISSIDRVVDSRSRTVTARIILSNKDRGLKPGMVGRARILKKKYQKSIVIPATSILRLQNGTSVMVVENNVARQRIVEIEVSTGDSVLIRKGLAAGEKLITTGAFQVSDGTKVVY